MAIHTIEWASNWAKGPHRRRLARSRHYSSQVKVKEADKLLRWDSLTTRFNAGRSSEYALNPHHHVQEEPETKSSESLELSLSGSLDRVVTCTYSTKRDDIFDDSLDVLEPPVGTVSFADFKMQKKYISTRRC